MKVAWSMLVSVVLLQGPVFAQIQAPAPAVAPAPEIEVVDGKVSMSALNMPLSRVISLLDRAMNMKSKIAPEVASRSISVRFKDLTLKDAVQKIFEGQPLNYSLIAGKGIDVSGAAVGTASAGTSFQDSVPISPTPVQGINPIQPAVPINPVGQPQIAPTGAVQNPANPNPAPTGATAPPPGVAAPGQLPTPIGGVNPLTQPVSAAPAPAVGFPLGTPPPQQPSGPGTVGGAGPTGATPGGITPGQIPR